MIERISGKILDFAALRPDAERHVASEKASAERSINAAELRAARIVERGYTPPTKYEEAVLEQDRKKMGDLSPEKLAAMLDEEQATPGTYPEIQKFAMAEALVNKLKTETE